MDPSPRSDRFGNPFAPGLAYARGSILAGTADDYVKLRTAWSHLQARRASLGKDGIHLLTGLERRLDARPEQLPEMDDELASALHLDRVTRLGIEHLGGDPDVHDVLYTNRLTAALLVAADVLIAPGQRVVGVSPSYSHPAVRRAVAHAGAEFHDVIGAAGLAAWMHREGAPDVVFLTRLAVTYEALDAEDLARVVAMARDAGALVLVDDAGGARVGPAVFDQPRTLALGVDVGATGLDKYGTHGPRVGLLGGERDVVARIRARAFEMGLEARQMLYPAIANSLEAYSPARVRTLVETTRAVGAALEQRIGAERVRRTPVMVELTADDVLDMALERGGGEPAIVPYEATAALAMLLVRDHGIMTVHFAGLPPGTAALMFKFVPPERLERLGGADELARRVDECLDTLSGLVGDTDRIAGLLVGGPASA